MRMNEPGECVECKSLNLEYGKVIFDKTLKYPYTCKDCGHEGMEHYDVIYNTST